MKATKFYIPSPVLARLDQDAALYHITRSQLVNLILLCHYGDPDAKAYFESMFALSPTPDDFPAGERRGE